MLNGFPTEKLKLYKRSGTIIENVEGLVDGKMIFTDNTSISLEEGDIFERELPGGSVERYEIIDRGFYRGMGSFPDNYQATVRKLTDIQRATSTKSTYNITAKQVNIANDNSNINVNQCNNIDIDELNSLIANVRQNIPQNICAEDLEIIDDNLEIIESEFLQSEPKKGFIKTAITGLKTIKGTIEFTAAITTLYMFIAKIFGWPSP